MTDIDIAGAGTISIPIRSDTEAGGETVTLSGVPSETGGLVEVTAMATGYFRQSFPIPVDAEPGPREAVKHSQHQQRDDAAADAPGGPRPDAVARAAAGH